MAQTNGINANTLKSKMAAKGLKQYTFAKAIGISNPTMNRIFQGKSFPTLDVIQRMGDVLDLSDPDFAEIFFNRQGGKE